MEKLFRNTLADGVDVYENFEDAHGSAIQHAAWSLKDLMLEKDEKYTKDPEELLALSKQLDAAAKVLLAAIAGKHVEVYSKAKK